MKKLAKIISWMRNEECHHGQQASEIARKTLRGISNRAVGPEEIVELAARFTSARKTHIDRNSARKPRAASWTMRFSSNRITARNLTCDKDIDATGREMGNCLGNPEFARDYKLKLRNHEIELIKLEDDQGIARGLMSVSLPEKRVEQIEGIRNEEVPIEFRGPIISVLVDRGFFVGTNGDCHALGICDELLTALSTGSAKRFDVGGRTCEIGNGVVVASRRNALIMLRIVDGRFRKTLSGSDDVKAARAWFRRACRSSSLFQDSCGSAFRSASAERRRRWFCIEAQRPSAQR